MKSVLILSVAGLSLSGCSTLSAKHAEGQHLDHAHAHGTDCGHVAVAHGNHTDYLHDGHMHHLHAGHVDEHVVLVSAVNPDAENPIDPDRHMDHMHGEGDTDHPMIPHGDHMDFYHDGHLHHPHGDHIDEHGPIES